MRFSGWRDVFRDLSALGSTLFFAILIIALLFNGLSGTALRVFLGYVLISAIAAVIRWAYFSERPEPQSYSNWLEKLDAGSFPSIHAARVQMAAVLLSAQFPNAYLIALFSLLAVLVMVSRVFLKRHSPRDVIAGQLLGAILAFAVMRLVAL